MPESPAVPTVELDGSRDGYQERDDVLVIRPSILASCLLAVLLPGCSGGIGAGTTTTDTAAATTTTSSPAETSTPSTIASNGLDLSGARWVMHGPEGIARDDGTLIWETQPFPAGLARDGKGGLVFTDSAGLWWFPAGSAEPKLVAAAAYELVAVVGHPDTPVALVWDDGPAYVDLGTGETVGRPGGSHVEVFADTGMIKWTAANELTAWIEPPDIVLDDEGQPAEVLQPARLVVGRGNEVLIEEPVGGVYETWAIIHDFDGLNLVLSRGPFEPAMPEETIVTIDLSIGEVTGAFTAGGTRVALTGADVDWDGPVADLDLGGYTPSPIATDEGVRSLQDGRYLTYIESVAADGSSLDLDLAVWFSGNEANLAASADGSVEVPVPNDYYIRNADPALLGMPVDPDVLVTSVWYDYDTDPDLANDSIGYQQFLEVMLGNEEGVRGALRTSPWWVTVEEGVIVGLDEQYLP